MPSQSEYQQQMRDTSASPKQRRDASLALLEMSKARAVLDDALRTLNRDNVLTTLDDSHRPVIRDKYLFYHHQPPEKDKAGMLREQLTRLLVHLAHPDDADIYLLGVQTYHHQPVDDVAQNLRAKALAGLAITRPDLGRIHATRLIGDDHTSVFNCEPSMTAINVLAEAGDILPIYQFILLRGEHFCRVAQGEAVGRALASLGDDFPAGLYRGLMAMFRVLDVASASAGIIEYITQAKRQTLYDDLLAFIVATGDDDLFHYGVMACAAARDDVLAQALIDLAKTITRPRISAMIRAIDLIAHPERDDTLATLRLRW